MTKRPDQHNIDQDEAGATDYKFRRETEDGARRPKAVDGSDDTATARTPDGAESSRRQSREDREDELERARQHTGSDPEPSDE